MGFKRKGRKIKEERDSMVRVYYVGGYGMKERGCNRQSDFPRMTQVKAENLVRGIINDGFFTIEDGVRSIYPASVIRQVDIIHTKERKDGMVG